jgi:uncharacterized protein (TIGR03000 family)
MFRKAVSFGGLLLLAGGLVLVTPGSGLAQGRGFREAGGYYGQPYARHGYVTTYGPPYGYGAITSYYGASPYDSLPVTRDSGYGRSYDGGQGNYSYGSTATPPADDSQSYYAPPATDNRARVTVNVPANAQVWFDDVATAPAGKVRQFTSPPLTPGIPYAYIVRARWNENGRQVLQSQQLEVSAGAHAIATFPLSQR